MGKEHMILGVSEDADEKTIKRAYFKLIREINLEQNPQRFELVRQAYEALQNKDEDNDRDDDDVILKFDVPDSPLAKAMIDQIRALGEYGDYKKAVKTAEEAIRYYGEMDVFVYEIARNALAGGMKGKAVSTYEKLYKKYPDVLYYGGELVKAYEQRGYVNKRDALSKEMYLKGYREFHFWLSYIYDNIGYLKDSELINEFADLLKKTKDEKLISEAEYILSVFYKQYDCVVFTDDFIGNFVKLSDMLTDFLDLMGRNIINVKNAITAVWDALLCNIDSPDEQLLEKMSQVKERIEKYLPDVTDNNLMGDFGTLMKFQDDNRISDMIKRSVVACLNANNSDKDYFDYVTLDVMMCQLRAWPSQKRDIAIMKKDYPDIYQCMSGLFDFTNVSKDDARYMLEQMMPKHTMMSKIYSGKSLYNELYPEPLENTSNVNVQWDSMNTGSYEREQPKIGRNDPCPCGSGKKYKKCCGK